MKLLSMLPAPTRLMYDYDAGFKKVTDKNLLVIPRITVFPNGQRRVCVPDKSSNFGNSGAFPEKRIVEYPLKMYQNGEECNFNALSVQPDAESKYELIARQGHSKDKTVYSRFTDLLPAEVIVKSYPSLQTSLQGTSFNSGTQQRVIRVFETPVDSLECSRLRINGKIPPGPPSLFDAVLSSPTRRETIPNISNWNNRRGYTVPLRKHLANNSRGQQHVHINDEVTQLAEAFYVADDVARASVKTRSQLKRKLAQKLKKRKVEHLRQLAQKPRNEHISIKRVHFIGDLSVINEKESERKKFRQSCHAQRRSERNLARVKLDICNRLQNETKPDIAQEIVLRMPASGSSSNETHFEQRLFRLAQGLGQVHVDEIRDLYDKPWRDNISMANHFCRPCRNIAENIHGAHHGNCLKTNSEDFSRTDGSGVDQSGPVQFKKEEDPFGIDRFLREARRASERKEHEIDDEREK